MHVSKVIKAPIETVWTTLIDTELWPVWGPSVKEVECPQRYISAGVGGRLRITAGPWVPFVVTVYEEQAYWHWHVAGLPATGHRLRELGANRCLLSFELPLAAFPYALVCRRAAGKIARLVENDVNF